MELRPLLCFANSLITFTYISKIKMVLRESFPLSNLKANTQFFFLFKYRIFFPEVVMR